MSEFGYLEVLAGSQAGLGLVLDSDYLYEIGCGEGCHLLLNDRSVKPLHAKTHVHEGRLVLTASGSGPVSVNSHEVSGSVFVEPGDVLSVGEIRLRFELAAFRLADTTTAADDPLIAAEEAEEAAERTLEMDLPVGQFEEPAEEEVAERTLVMDMPEDFSPNEEPEETAEEEPADEEIAERTLVMDMPEDFPPLESDSSEEAPEEFESATPATARLDRTAILGDDFGDFGGFGDLSDSSSGDEIPADRIPAPEDEEDPAFGLLAAGDPLAISGLEGSLRQELDEAQAELRDAKAELERIRAQQELEEKARRTAQDAQIELAEQVAALQARAKSAEEERDGLQETVERHETRQAEEASLREGLEVALSHAQSEGRETRLDLEGQLGELEAGIDAAKNEARRLEGELAAATTEQERLRSELERNETELKTLLNSAEGEREALINVALEERGDLRTQIRLLEDALAQTRQSLAAAEGATVEAQASSDRHQADAERKASQIAELERELSAAQALVATGKEAGRRVEALVGELAVARDRRTQIEGELQEQRAEAGKLGVERDALTKTVHQAEVHLAAFKRELQHTEARLKSEVEAARADAKSKARDANQLRLRLDDAARKAERSEEAARRARGERDVLVRRTKGLQGRARELEARCQALTRQVAKGGVPVVTRKPQQAPQAAPKSAPRAAPRKKGLVLMGSILDRVAGFDEDEPQKVASKPPAKRPPAKRPPAGRPPAKRPPAKRPPAGRPSAKRPPAKQPPQRRPAPPKPGRSPSARPARPAASRPAAKSPPPKSSGRPTPLGNAPAPRDPATGKPATRKPGPKPKGQSRGAARPAGAGQGRAKGPARPGPKGPKGKRPPSPPKGKRPPPPKPKRPPRSN